MRAEKLALSRMSGLGLITPRQLGPTTRTPASLQRATIWSSISSPSSADFAKSGRNDDDSLDAFVNGVLGGISGPGAVAG